MMYSRLGVPRLGVMTPCFINQTMQETFYLFIYFQQDKIGNYAYNNVLGVLLLVSVSHN